MPWLLENFSPIRGRSLFKCPRQVSPSKEIPRTTPMFGAEVVLPEKNVSRILTEQEDNAFNSSSAITRADRRPRRGYHCIHRWRSSCDQRCPSQPNRPVNQRWILCLWSESLGRRTLWAVQAEQHRHKAELQSIQHCKQCIRSWIQHCGQQSHSRQPDLDRDWRCSSTYNRKCGSWA